jgi:hypothetical protein
MKNQQYHKHNNWLERIMCKLRQLFTKTYKLATSNLNNNNAKTKIHNLRNEDIDHNVAPKQMIHSSSPAQEAQRDFIDEGGNSQP